MTQKINTDLISYYKARSTEYDRIYLRPDRKEDLNNASVVLKNLFAKKTVLEIACGTGYWTEKIAEQADSVLAFDVNESVIEIARQKRGHRKNTSYEVADIYEFKVSKKFNALFGGFIWSHIPLQDLDHFLSVTSSFVEPGGTIVFMDNNFVVGSSTPITYTDENGNTFQTRELENKSSHLVLKNFPSEEFIRHKISSFTNDITFINLKYYWIITCKITL